MIESEVVFGANTRKPSFSAQAVHACEGSSLQGAQPRGLLIPTGKGQGGSSHLVLNTHSSDSVNTHLKLFIAVVK